VGVDGESDSPVALAESLVPNVHGHSKLVHECGFGVTESME
jgi:hypothetical protein